MKVVKQLLKISIFYAMISVGATLLLSVVLGPEKSHKLNGFPETLFLFGTTFSFIALKVCGSFVSKDKEEQTRQSLQR
jgi:hypothetical protein